MAGVFSIPGSTHVKKPGGGGQRGRVATPRCPPPPDPHSPYPPAWSQRLGQRGEQYCHPAPLEPEGPVLAPRARLGATPNPTRCFAAKSDLHSRLSLSYFKNLGLDSLLFVGWHLDC